MALARDVSFVGGGHAATGLLWRVRGWKRELWCSARLRIEQESYLPNVIMELRVKVTWFATPLALLYMCHAAYCSR